MSEWDTLPPADAEWLNSFGQCDTRRELVCDLRQLADFLESRPDVPVPRHPYVVLNVFAAGTDAEQVRLAPEAARVFSEYGMPLAGAVTERVVQDSRATLYQVRLTGGQRVNTAPAMLKSLTFEPVATSRGAVIWLSDAETLVVGALARCGFRLAAGRPVLAADATDVEREVGKLQAAERMARRAAVAAPTSSRRMPGRPSASRRGQGK